MRIHPLNPTQPGWLILLAVSVLVGVGMACIYVTDTHYVAGHDGPANAAKQGVRVLISVGVGVGILWAGYPSIARYAYTIFFLALALLVPLLLAKLLHESFGGLTAPRNGAYRWIHLPGFPLQPSEFMKIAGVLGLASYLRFRKNYRQLGGLLVPLALAVIPLGLILLEPDLGTALLLLPVLFGMLFVAGARIRHLVLLALIGVAMSPLAWGQIRGYQRARVTAVLFQSEGLRRAVIERPEKYQFLAGKRQAMEWAASSGFQLVHSKNAIGSGGLSGYGWGDGVYVQNPLLPDRHNDFVFALVAHQWGLLGCLVVLACYALIVLAGTRIASATMDPVGRMLAAGVVLLLACQAGINVGMATGLLPTTGMTLPFVSYGGSSLLCNFIAAALLISVSQHRPYLIAEAPFEFRDAWRVRRHFLEVGDSERSRESALVGGLMSLRQP